TVKEDPDVTTGEIANPDPPSPPAAAARPRLHLFLASFSILFLELVLIRWIPAYLRMFGYFTNFVLLGSLLGAGIGALTHRKSRLALPPFALLLVGLVGLTLANKYTLELGSTEELFSGAAAHASQENYWIIPLIFGLVVLVFVPLGHALGRLLTTLPPLTAYAIDIAGSLCGIAVFTALAFLSARP